MHKPIPIPPPQSMYASCVCLMMIHIYVYFSLFLFTALTRYYECYRHIIALRKFLPSDAMLSEKQNQTMFHQ